MPPAEASHMPTLPDASGLLPWALPSPGAVLAGWGLFLAGVILLALLTRWRRPTAPTQPRPPGPLGRGELAWAAAGCLLLAVLVTWPMAVSGALVQRNFDGYGSAWLLHRLATGGGGVELLDTWLYALLGTPIAWLVGPVRAYALTTLLGLWSLGLASWWTARVPFRLPGGAAAVAAIAAMANPLVGSAIAEGHGGILVGPGLPLLLGALQLQPGARPWRWALAVAGASLLCALQSGYFAYLAAGLLPLWSAWMRRPLWRPLLLLALPVALFALWTLLETSGVDGGDRWAWYRWHLTALPPPAVVSLDRLAGNPPGSVILLHGTRAALGFGLLVLGVVAPLLRGDRTDRGLALLALLALLLALGPQLRLTCDPQGTFGLTTPFGWLAAQLPALALFRLPARFLWLFYLSAGLGAARFAATLPRPGTHAVAALLLLELLLVGARPWEPRSTLAEVPSAYAALEPDDTVLDLWPAFGEHHPQAVEIKELSCFYQVAHRRPLPMACLTVQLGESRLLSLNQQVHLALAQGSLRAPELQGVTALAWHADAFDPARIPALSQRMESWWGPPLAVSSDAGEQLRVYRTAPAP